MKSYYSHDDCSGYVDPMDPRQQTFEYLPSNPTVVESERAAILDTDQQLANIAKYVISFNLAESDDWYEKVSLTRTEPSLFWPTKLEGSPEPRHLRSGQKDVEYKYVVSKSIFSETESIAPPCVEGKSVSRLVKWLCQSMSIHSQYPLKFQCYTCLATPCQ